MIKIKTEETESHTISILVDNEAGALARVIGLFSGRGYNIESLSVAEIDQDKHKSRITIVTNGSMMIINQIKSQLERLVPVHSVIDITSEGPSIEREMALIKVVCSKNDRDEVIRLSEVYRAKTVDTTQDSFIFELTGNIEKINSFVDLLRPLGGYIKNRSSRCYQGK